MPAAPPLLAWAAVGPLPQEAEALLDPQRRLQLADVPLVAAPPWLGLDRALVGWWAWRLGGGQRPVLVADAGTALSLTAVSGEGRFLGGRLLAGAGLQWRALARGTAALPALEPLPESEARPAGEATGHTGDDGWPQTTEAALRVGVLRGLAAALQAAAAELPAQPHPWQLWLTGGDAQVLDPLLTASGSPWRLAPDLALQALAALRPGPDR